MRIKLFFLLLAFAVLPVAAQHSGLRGAVIDAESGTPIPGATVLLLEQGISATTGPNGDFLISNAMPGNDQLTVIAYGYEDIVRNVEIFANNVIDDLGVLEMTPSDKTGRESMIILDENQLEDEEGNDQTIGILSGASDDIYYSAANYDFSVMRFRMRGYDSEYAQTFINGVQFTDAIRGRFNYSMLGGMNQAFKNRSVGIGQTATNFTLGEIGGTTNINTMAKDYAPGFRGTLSYTNGAYTTRGMITYSTGLNDKGWAFTLSAIGRYSKEGITEGTFYHSGGLFLSLQKVFNDQHCLGITMFGAPTQRATSSATYEEAYVLADSYMYNPNWGWQDGKKRSARIVESFDPTAIINWIWKPKTGTTLTTGAAIRYSMYSSSALNWYNAADPRPDYYRYLPSYYKDNQEAFDLYTDLWRNNESQRQIDWESLYRANQLTKLHSEQTGEDYRGSTYIVENRHSNQKNVLFNSTLNHRLNDFMTLQGGVGVNFTQASYYKTIRDLLGGDYWTDTDQYAERDFPDRADMLQNDLNNPDRKVGVDDKFGYHYNINSVIATAWLQNMINLSHWDINYGLKMSYTQYQRDGKMRNGRAPENSYGKGAVHVFDNTAIKAGATYKIDGRNFIIANVSYGTRAPLADNVYISPRIKDDVVDNIKSERILSADLSYTFNYNRFRGTLTGFWTNIYDGTDRSSFYDDGLSTFVNYLMTDIDKTHKGVELGLSYKITPDLTVSAAGTISRYQYKNRPTSIRSAENGSVEDLVSLLYLKNFYVGGTPQTAGSLSINYNAPKMWFFEVNGTWLGDSYIELTPIRHMYMSGLVSFVNSVEEYEAKVREITTQEKLRDAFVLNASIGKVIYVNRKLSLNFNLSVNNILNKQNIQTGGYQQSRFDYTNYDVTKYANRYYYAQGIRIFANIGVRF